jgi:2,4-dienoyl-CoA reductase-like NADH-dependent reductase (Old Yellow Enzyme family)
MGSPVSNLRNDDYGGDLTGRMRFALEVAEAVRSELPYAQRVRRDTGLKTMAVGLIVEANQAEEILERGDADLICLGRELLHNPHWPLHARVELEGDDGFDRWPPQVRWSLKRRAPWAAKYKSGQQV